MAAPAQRHQVLSRRRGLEAEAEIGAAHGAFNAKLVLGGAARSLDQNHRTQPEEDINRKTSTNQRP